MAYLWGRINALRASLIDNSRTSKKLEKDAATQSIPRDDTELDGEEERYERSAQEVLEHHYAVLHSMEERAKWQRLKDFLFHVFVAAPAVFFLYLLNVHGNEATFEAFELVLNELKPIGYPLWSILPEAATLPFYDTLSRWLWMALVAGIHWMIVLVFVVLRAFWSEKVDWFSTLGLGILACAFLLLRA